MDGTRTNARPLPLAGLRVVQLGRDPEPLDRDACCGTHVASTGEIGLLRIGRIEKKGRENRRVNLHFAE